MEIKSLPINQIKAYENNPRMNDNAVSEVRKSISEFGFQQPLVIDKNNEIIVGHTRMRAATELGLAEVPCVVADDLTEEQVKAYRIMDNKSAEFSQWNYGLLTKEMTDLLESDYDLSLTGFNEDELDDLNLSLTSDFVDQGLTDEEDLPDISENQITYTGDIWILGKHKLICGDATNLSDWDALKIEKGAVVFTSPPYNLGSSIKLRGNKSLDKLSSPYSTYKDNATESEYISLIEKSMSCGMAHCDVVSLNLQPLAKSKRPLMKFLSDYASHLIDIITWDKGNAAPIIAEGVMSSRYEWIFLYSNKNNASRSIPYASWRGKWSNVYAASGQKNNEFSKIHGATFPVHLPEFICGDLMNRCRGIVDCFAGTGTTMIAAEKLGKSSYCIEIDPRYCDVIIQRWQNYTGKDAIHQESQKLFKELQENTVNGE